MPLSDREAFLAKLEDAGETTVQKNLDSHVYGIPTNLADPKISVVIGWLKAKAEARAALREQESLAISKEALSIAKDANRIASEQATSARASSDAAYEQARWARWAAIIAMLAAIITAKDQILSLIVGHP